jgi:hypothetical protein
MKQGRRDREMTVVNEIMHDVIIREIDFKRIRVLEVDEIRVSVATQERGTIRVEGKKIGVLTVESAAMSGRILQGGMIV